MIEVGNIVKNINPAEAVKIARVKKLGESFSLTGIGVNSNKVDSKILSKEQLESLEVLTDTGKFNFKGDPEKFILFAEAERVNSAYQFDPLFAINCSVVNPLPHQVEAVYKYLLPQPQIRFLLADDTGAGKTIMTGLLLKEMLLRGQIERVLIVTPGGLTKQWQEDEMLIKFNISFTLANRASFNADPTIFQNHDRVVTSIDFICRDDIQAVLSKTNWDLIVFDGDKLVKVYKEFTVPMLTVEDESCCLVHTSVSMPAPGPTPPEPGPNPPTPTVYRTVTISGQVPMENYAQLFSSFIQTLKNNHLKINISFEAKSTEASPLAENSQLVKSIKESASQLGLNIDLKE